MDSSLEFGELVRHPEPVPEPGVADAYGAVPKLFPVARRAGGSRWKRDPLRVRASICAHYADVRNGWRWGRHFRPTNVVRKPIGLEQSALSTENRTNPIPSRGSIKCPYCDCVVVQDAKLLGQTILCPKCHAQFKAPRSGATEFHSNSLGKPELRPTLLKVFGVLLLVIACISGLRFLSMDTSVAVEHQVNGWTQVERVNNLGLMDDRRNWLIISGFTALIGALFFGLGFLVEKRPVSTGEALDAKVGDSNTPRS